MSKTKKPRCDTRETNGDAWRGCVKAPGHPGKCKFGAWSLSVEQCVCARCGHQDNLDEFGACDGCGRDCCMACLNDGTCQSCLNEEREADLSINPNRVPQRECLQVMSRILKLCQDAEESYRYSDNEAMEDRALGLLEKLEKISELARGFLPG